MIGYSDRRVTKNSIRKLETESATVSKFQFQNVRTFLKVALEHFSESSNVIDCFEVALRMFQVALIPLWKETCRCQRA